MQLVEKPE